MVRQEWGKHLWPYRLPSKLKPDDLNARALNRKYARISLGGESDSSVLKGHRRTYIGAYPGKIINALKSCGSENCVIILDEVNHHTYF